MLAAVPVSAAMQPDATTNTFAYTLYIEYEVVNGTRYVPQISVPSMYTNSGCGFNLTECSWYVGTGTRFLFIDIAPLHTAK